MSYPMDYQGGDSYGGGFSTDNNNNNNFPSSSQGSGGGGRRNYDEQSIIPVTARMVLAAQTDPADVNQLNLEDGRKLFHVKLVGAVRSVEKNSTNYHYQIEDGTGLVEVKQWLDEQGCTALQEQMNAAAEKEHQYVKVVAKPNMYDNKCTLVADSVQVVATGNQLAHHFLEVVYSGEKFKHSESIVQPTSPMMGVVNSPSGGGVGFGGPPSGGSSGRTPVVSMAQSGSGDAVRDAVLNYVQQYGEQNEYGANIGNCIASLSHFNEPDIRNAIENLQAEGMIYSTINEENFKTAM